MPTTDGHLTISEKRNATHRFRKIVTEERFYLNEIGLQEDLCRGIRKKPSELALHLVRKGRFAPSEKTHQAWKIRVELPEGL